MVTETNVIDAVEHQGKTSHIPSVFYTSTFVFYANETSSCSGNNARL